MKIDCSKTENYFTEKRRMTDMCNDKKCKTCPLSFYHNEAELSCDNFEQKYPKKAVEMVQKWSNEHPRKTKKEAFLEVFSNAIIGHDGYPSIPPCKIYGIADVEIMLEQVKYLLDIAQDYIELIKEKKVSRTLGYIGKNKG